MFHRVNRLLWTSLLALFLLGATVNAQDIQVQSFSETSSEEVHVPKKRVLILTTSGGGGHTAAAQAVRESLEGGYDVTIIDMMSRFPIFESAARAFDEHFARQQWVAMGFKLMFPRIFGEDIAIYYHEKSMVQLIVQAKPDLIVSVLPTANFLYLKEAKALKVPFIVIPTDFTPTEFFHRIGTKKDSDSVSVVLPFRDDKILGYFKKRKLDHIEYDGYPVRRVFSDLGNRLKRGELELQAELKAYGQSQFQVQPDRGDKVVLLSMGARGFGSTTIEKYANVFLNHGDKMLKSDQAHLHLMVVCGSNVELYERLEQLRLHQESGLNSPRVHIHPLSWMSADQMAKVMALSHLVVTKPGGSTVAETLTMGRYMLLFPDSTKVLKWEKANLNLVVSQGWGQPLLKLKEKNKNIAQVVKQIAEALSIEAAAMPENHFHENFIKTVDHLLEKNSL